jgi:hypothetical protein
VKSKKEIYQKQCNVWAKLNYFCVRINNEISPLKLWLLSYCPCESERETANEITRSRNIETMRPEPVIDILATLLMYFCVIEHDFGSSPIKRIRVNPDEILGNKCEG